MIFLKVSKRVISLVLVVVLAFGMVYIAPFASAAFVYNPQPSYGAAFYSAFRTGVGVLIGADLDSVEYDFTFTIHGLVTDSQLDKAKEDYNSFVGRFVRLWAPIWYAGSALTTAKKAYDTENNIWRLADTSTGKWIVDSLGRFPYFESVVAGGGSLKELSPDTNPAPEVNKLDGNQWISEAQVNKQLLNINPAYSYDELEAHAQTLRLVEKTGRYTYSVMKHGTAGYYGLAKIEEDKAKPVIQWLADKDGHPYFTTKDKYQLAINQTVNNVVQDGNGNAVVIQGQTVTTEKPIIDQSQMEVNIPVTNDNSISIGEYINQKIDSISYNFDDHSYTVNTYDVTYNNDNRRYTTNYYTWNITYNITNTYVTYIGSNDAYQQKEYEFYYELPDGRSSADLTADEVAGLSFQFADVMNYQRSATDSNLRALYHFDGDLSDAGFFSDKTAFSWQQGASITYMDSSVFDGALYLDETAHKFDVTLPSNIRANEDFTIQFRYYQASQPDTLSNIENTFAVGGTVFFKWDERYLYDASGLNLGSLPVGNWCELALVRHGGTVYLYVNGIKVTSWTNSAALGKVFSFALGSTSRAYSMLDELRVLNFAIAQSGAGYTPTSVPYDSNLVLVLPGEEKVVDEWWEFQSPNNLLSNPDFTVDGYPFPSASSTPNGQFRWRSSGTTYSPAFVSLDDGLLTLGSTSSSASFLDYTNVPYGFFYPLYYLSSSNVASYAPGLVSSDKTSATTFTFSVVDVLGEVYSLTFPFSTSAKTASFSWGKLEYKYAKKSSGYGEQRAVFITPASGKSIDIVYAELVKGSASEVVATKVASVFDLSTLKPNTAAVQTDIPIHGYTVGGVRPTFPVRGDVWFAVTNGRVSSVQVYTGSAWTSSNARWWTGSRWIPIYAFDIYTLEDCWDIADSGDVITPIESDTAGWNWWKKAWTDFRSWLGGVFSGGGSGGGGSGGDYTYPSVYPSTPVDNPSIKDDDGTETTIWDFPGKLFSGLWDLLTGLVDVVGGGVGGLFSLIGDGVGGFFGAFGGEDGVFQFFTYGGADIWD